MDRQSLSWHPYIDQYGPKFGAIALVSVTSIFALSELYSNWVAPYLSRGTSSQLVDGQEAQSGQFSHRLRVFDQPIPYEEWPVNVDGAKIFQPTYDWQEVPEGCVCPPGLEYQMNTQTGRRLARAIRK